MSLRALCRPLAAWLTRWAAGTGDRGQPAPATAPDAWLCSAMPDGTRMMAELIGFPSAGGYEDIGGVVYGLMDLGTLTDKAGFSREHHAMTREYCDKLMLELYRMHDGFNPVPAALTGDRP
jgi:hypothetical protein